MSSTSNAEASEQTDILRCITCGSVDDGKSTLIGRLLYETRQIPDDQLANLENESTKYGARENEIDFALLTDGLSAEREQGITIDIAYRFFTTDKRRFILADTPGHKEYTRNMVTAASMADIAILLVDATKGLVEQSRRHLFIASLLGVKEVVVAVNKMDLVDFSEQAFDKVEEQFVKFSKSLAFNSLKAIPLSATLGDNIVRYSRRMPWYKGPSLLDYLNLTEIRTQSGISDFALPVQLVNRHPSGSRSYAGIVEAGSVTPGSEIRNLPSGEIAVIEKILLGNEKIDCARQGYSVSLTLDRDIDVSRGNILTSLTSSLYKSDQIESSIVWMTKEPGYIGRSYWFALGTTKVSAAITDIKFKKSIMTQDRLSAKSLELNDIAEVKIRLSRPVVFSSYSENRNLGGFILIDRYSFSTIAAGMITYPLRRAANLRRQELGIDRAEREALNNQKGKVFWLTGLSGAGKSTIANSFEKALFERGFRTYVLDGDNLRLGLNADLGFTDADRIENIRRLSEVAMLMLDAGLIVIVAAITPFRPERDAARALFKEGDFVEVFVDAPIHTAEKRDTKGLYKKARTGNLDNFTGVGSSYEAPVNPEIHLPTAELSVEQSVDRLLNFIGVL